METKKVYVIDRSGDFSYTEKLRELLGYSEDTEMICVQSMEDIPFEETIRSDRHNIMELHNYSMKPDIKFEPIFKDKHKGHERSYKYHR